MSLTQAKQKKAQSVLLDVMTQYQDLYATTPGYGQLQKTNYTDYVFSKASSLITSILNECLNRTFRQDVLAEVENVPLDSVFTILQIIASKKASSMTYETVNKALGRGVQTVLTAMSQANDSIRLQAMIFQVTYYHQIHLLPQYPIRYMK